ncbi:MAG: CocE/NonD family hydrolase [Chloroflexi bacterium]|nr:CocE/NonD family hydrolase [Chloroflexota bacterium]
MAVQKQARKARLSPATYDVLLQSDVMVPMRDGVLLAADLYLPARNGRPVRGRLPAVLERTPYGKHDPDRQERHGAYYARRGYVAVIQDCRGCHASGGELDFLVQEPNDGYDTVAWILKQPWSNGKVGTFGTSYMAWVQSGLATQDPPGLACMLPNMGGWNAWDSAVRHNGAMELRFMAWAFWHSALNSSAALKPQPWLDRALHEAPDFRGWLQRMPIRQGQTQLSLVPNYERWCLELFTHADYDDYWRQPGLGIEEHLTEHADVPIYLSGGWYASRVARV